MAARSTRSKQSGKQKQAPKQAQISDELKEELLTKISIHRGSITDLRVDCVVNAANDGLWAGAGVCGAIFRAAGHGKLSQECDQIISKYGRVSTGDSVLTKGYNLYAKHIIHSVGPMSQNNQALVNCYRTALDLCILHNIRSIAFPCISTGVFGFSKRAAAPLALRTVRDYLLAAKSIKYKDYIKVLRQKQRAKDELAASQRKKRSKYSSYYGDSDDDQDGDADADEWNDDDDNYTKKKKTKDFKKPGDDAKANAAEKEQEKVKEKEEEEEDAETVFDRLDDIVFCCFDYGDWQLYQDLTPRVFPSFVDDHSYLWEDKVAAKRRQMKKKQALANYNKSQGKNGGKNSKGNVKKGQGKKAPAMDVDSQESDNDDSYLWEDKVAANRRQTSYSENTKSGAQTSQLFRRNIRTKTDSKNAMYNLTKVLVVLICIEQYDSQHIVNLPGTQTDKQRLNELFTEEYKYDVLATKSARVTKDDLDGVLFAAKMRFRKEEHGYQAIIVLYSGHGDAQRLRLSDYDETKPNSTAGSYFRDDLEAFFNGERQNVPEKIDAFKFFVIDACRGSTVSEVKQIEIKTNTKASLMRVDGGKGDKYVHPGQRIACIYANVAKFEAYEVPYDEQAKDIANHRLTKATYMKNDEWPKCGILMNAVWNVLHRNATTGFKMNWAEIQEAIQEKVEQTVVPVIGNFNCKVGQIATPGGPMRISEKLRIIFGRNARNDQSDAAM